MFVRMASLFNVNYPYIIMLEGFDESFQNLWIFVFIEYLICCLYIKLLICNLPIVYGLTFKVYLVTTFFIFLHCRYVCASSVIWSFVL